ncbi:MAG: ribosome-associated translation inhibitor RaiA [Deltaproteobacteria bacterium]|jgi:putative sigma-54 modulation protein|nr:ribosome-associated translation inhibitor RaiA [Deltaproteobacteria bacterium]
MHIAFTFKNFEPSEHLKKYARRRFEKLGRFFGKAAGLDVQVCLHVDKFRHKCDVQVGGEGLQLSAAEQTEDMYGSIDLVLDKLESQIKKHVSRVKEHRRQSKNTVIDVFAFPLQEEGGERTITGTSKFEPKPMHVDEALMQLESSENEFLVFLNAESERVNVIYHRRNGGYGLIDPIV